MLKPIPSKILKSTATVKVCSGVDRTESNTDCTLRAILFVDAHTSTPALDWCGLLRAAHVNCGDMRVVVRDVMYTVMGVDELRDDTDNLHHWEVSLV